MLTRTVVSHLSPVPIKNEIALKTTNRENRRIVSYRRKLGGSPKNTTAAVNVEIKCSGCI